MCGRYVSVQADSDLLAEFEAIDASAEPVATRPLGVVATGSMAAVATGPMAAAAAGPLAASGYTTGPNAASGYTTGPMAAAATGPIAASGYTTGPMAAAATGYNVAPTDPVRAIVNRKQRDENGRSVGAPVRQLRVMAWGLVPSWSKDRSGAARMINARSESVASKPAFKRAFATRRCLIPADGWYEWRKGAAAKDPKQPFFMTPTDGHGLAFAGLYEFWSDPNVTDAPTLTTCTIITVPSAGDLETIHDRMPLVLPARSWTRWLDPGVTDPLDLVAAWDEAAGEHLELRPVSTQVNSVRNDGPELIDRVETAADAEAPARLF